jgi:hypothetical protein
LAAFQRETGRGCVSGAEAFRAFALPAFDRYRAAFGWGPAEDAVLAWCTAAADRWADGPVPVCAVHGDFAPGNLLLTDAGAPRRLQVSGVVDWELGRVEGTPFTDLFKLVGSYGSFLDRAIPAGRSGLRGHPGWEEVRRLQPSPEPWPNLVGFLYAFTGTGWFPDLVRRYLADGYARMGVAPGLQDAFLPAFVAEQATTLQDPVYRNGYRALLHAMVPTTGERPPVTSAVSPGVSR